MPDMELKDFGKYLRGTSVAKLLRRARKESLKQITANAEDLEDRYGLGATVGNGRASSHREPWPAPRDSRE